MTRPLTSGERARKTARIAGLYPIVDDTPRRRHELRSVLSAILDAGAPVVQLRLKHTPDRESLELARWSVDRAHAAGALLIVNDRFDLAALAGADGVHLGADDVPVERIPPAIRDELLVGLSTHTLEQVEASRARPVDYIGFGPIFATGSKESEYTPRGIPLLAQAAESAQVPVVAIGGIDTKRIAEVKRAGAAAAAVISAISEAESPLEATRALLRELIHGAA